MFDWWSALARGELYIPTPLSISILLLDTRLQRVRAHPSFLSPIPPSSTSHRLSSTFCPSSLPASTSVSPTRTQLCMRLRFAAGLSGLSGSFVGHESVSLGREVCFVGDTVLATTLCQLVVVVVVSGTTLFRCWSRYQHCWRCRGGENGRSGQSVVVELIVVCPERDRRAHMFCAFQIPGLSE